MIDGDENTGEEKTENQGLDVEAKFVATTNQVPACPKCEGAMNCLGSRREKGETVLTFRCTACQHQEKATA